MSGYDIIGDVHGCVDELYELLYKLYPIPESRKGRTTVFCGDLCDRGPGNVGVLRLVMSLVNVDTKTLVVLGNHDDKLRRYLKGNKVKVSHGLDKTIGELSHETQEFREEVLQFLNGLPWRLKLDDGKLIVVHGAAPKFLQESTSKKARSAALYGMTSGKTLPNGFPERLDWAGTYNGEATVVHGHEASLNVQEKNNVWNIDTACVFGGHLTAFRYPEMGIVQVKAKATYDPKEF